MSGRDVIVVVAITAGLALTLTGAIGSASDSRGSAQSAFASDQFGFSANLPEGWSHSAEQLVPLLLPREVLSVGTAAMPVGGGGNCGREPVAAIARMKSGDALVSIQEYTVTRRMRPRLARTFPLLTAYSGLGRRDLRRHPRPSRSAEPEVPAPLVHNPAVPRPRTRFRCARLPRGAAVARAPWSDRLDLRGIALPGNLAWAPREPLR